MNWETILCLGDSITIGSRSYLGYPEYCAASLSKKTSKSWNVVNCAVAGFTIIDLVRHIDRNWSNIREQGPLIASIMIGTNDLKSNTPTREFEIAYTLLILKTKLLIGSHHIVLNKIPLLQKGVMLPYSLKMNKMAQAYNEIIQQLSKREGLMLNTMPESNDFFLDGVHLNELGSRIWGENLTDRILELRNVGE